jgi:NAD(P)-dependent dehydrogenase (short-subunit alcohol dehydrogenase family)
MFALRLHSGDKTMIDYNGQVALVTGAASGIGRALAIALNARGAKLVLADINAELLVAAREEISGDCIAIPCDLADESAPAALIEHAWAHFGRVDLVCANAGMGGRGGKLAKARLDDNAKRLFAVNMFAPLLLAQAMISKVVGAGGRGRILITGSENSLSIPSAVQNFGLGLYAGSKHGVLAFAEWLHQESPGTGIDVHVLLPGAVYTPMISRNLPDPAKAPPELGLLMPERCAELALKGMDLGLFYIPTHAHLFADMMPRYEGVAESLKALGLRT